MRRRNVRGAGSLLAAALALVPMVTPSAAIAGNPVFEGWYADPDAHVFEGRYWIFPTTSALYEKQMHFDAFSSTDLVAWTKHPRVLEGGAVGWSRQAMWAPSVVEKDGKYYFFFGANDIKSNAELGGIGVAVADRPEGPYRDLLGKPLVATIENGAQPIDQFVFRDGDAWYMVYGGWKHANLVRLKDDFSGLLPHADGTTFKEITPAPEYVEGSVMFERKGRWYYMWSEGGWGRPDYSVAYAIADAPTGPFTRIGKVLEQDPAIATSAGHHSVINIPGTDRWVIAYHRRPKGDDARDHRQVAIETMEFDADGRIRPVRITHSGVAAEPLPRTGEASE